MTGCVAGCEDNPCPACQVEALSVLQQLVYADGFEALQDLAHLGPLFEHLGRGLERPQFALYVRTIGGMRQHPRSALAHEGGTRTDVVEILVGKDYAPYVPQPYASVGQRGSDRLRLARQ